MAPYAHPEALVDTQWVADHLDDPAVRLVEVASSRKAYEEGHIPGAVAWVWRQDLQQHDRHDVPDKATFEALLSRSGIDPDTTIVLYGVDNNWYPGFAYWLLTIYGHKRMRVLDGGRQKWLAEDRPLTTEEPAITPTTYRASEPDWSVRARRDDVLDSLGSPKRVLVDVRLPEEYRGELFAPGQPPQFGARAGHIPGAVHVPWELARNDDGTFKPADELRAVYGARGVTPDKEVIPYCTIGGRSGYVWFVLSQLLGYPHVRLYDGSWGEWGNLLGVPVEQ